MPWLVIKEGKRAGERQWVEDDRFQAAVASDLYEIPDDTNVSIRDTVTGDVSDASGADAAGLLESETLRGETGAEAFSREDRARMEREHDGIGNAIGTGALSLANSATLGATDYALGLAGGDDYKTWRKENKQVHDIADVGGEVLGYLAPSGLAKAPGLIGKAAKFAPAGAVERLGARVAATGAGKGFAKSAGAKALGYGLEGGLVGAGETLSEYGLATTELERERAASNLSSNVLFGAAVGGGLGVGSEVAARGLRKAKKLADAASEKFAKSTEVAGDLASLDREGLRTAKATALDELGTDVLADVRVSMDTHTDSMFKAFEGADKKVLADTRGARGWLTKSLDDPRGIIENPNTLAKSLRKEEELLRKTIDNQTAALAQVKKVDDGVLAQLDELLSKGKGGGTKEAKKLEGFIESTTKQRADRVARLEKMKPGKQADNLRAIIEKGDEAIPRWTAQLEEESGKAIKIKGDIADLYGNVYGRKVSKKQGIKIGRDKLLKFRDELAAGAADEMRASAAAKLPDALADNLALQSKISDIKTGSASRLAEIRAAQDALSTTAKKGTVHQMLEAGVAGASLGVMAPVVGFTGAGLLAGKVSAAISDVVMGTFGKAAGKTAKASADVAARFVDAAAGTLEKTPPLATKILAGVRFAEKTPKLPATLPKATLVRDFKAREAEIYSQVTTSAGGLTMRPSARKQLANRLSGVRAASPELADSLETIANRKLSFLASKLPKKPDFLAHGVGPDDWHPGNEAIRAFARYVAAVEDPAGVEDRLADGTLTPQDVEAYQAVYPERYAALRNDIAARLPDLQTSLPIAKRMALSIFTGLPVEPSMTPNIFRRIQAQFHQEPGTAGGTQAPQVTPNHSEFGSIKSQDKPTKSQERAE